MPHHEDLLSADSAMDAVTLFVRNREAMTTHYTQALGLTTLREIGPATVLGRGTEALVVLRHESDLPRPTPGQAGLFHTALLFATERALASVVASAARQPQSRYVGSADHLVSKAFYFTDPEGNGIELYWDRPRSEWIWDSGRVRMASLPLGPNEFLTEHLPQGGDTSLSDADAGAIVGHIHLQVGDTARAKAFYVDTLGFETTAELPGALFVSAGGYHHHMAMNTWNSAGAGPRAASLGLGQVSIDVPGRDDVEALAERLRHHGIRADDDGATLRFADPWNTAIEVSPRPAAAA